MAGVGLQGDLSHLLLVPKLEMHEAIPSLSHKSSWQVEVKLSLCFLTEHHAMEAHWGSEV